MISVRTLANGDVQQIVRLIGDALDSLAGEINNSIPDGPEER